MSMSMKRRKMWSAIEPGFTDLAWRFDCAKAVKELRVARPEMTIVVSFAIGPKWPCWSCDNGKH